MKVVWLSAPPGRWSWPKSKQKLWNFYSLIDKTSEEIDDLANNGQWPILLSEDSITWFGFISTIGKEPPQMNPSIAPRDIPVVMHKFVGFSNNNGARDETRNKYPNCDGEIRSTGWAMAEDAAHHHCRPLSREMAQFWDAACFPKAQRATDNELCVQAIGCRARSKSTNCTGKTEFFDRPMISKYALL